MLDVSARYWSAGVVVSEVMIVNRTNRTVKIDSITLDRIPVWADSMCIIEERKGRTFLVARTKVRRWQLWRDRLKHLLRRR